MTHACIALARMAFVQRSRTALLKVGQSTEQNTVPTIHTCCLDLKLNERNSQPPQQRCLAVRLSSCGGFNYNSTGSYIQRTMIDIAMTTNHTLQTS